MGPVNWSPAITPSTSTPPTFKPSSATSKTTPSAPAGPTAPASTKTTYSVLQRENFRKAYLGGATLGFGNDGGVYPHGDNWHQFPYMTEFGMKPIEAIRAATLTNAALMNLNGNAGQVTKGHWADIIALDADPLADPNHAWH